MYNGPAHLSTHPYGIGHVKTTQSSYVAPDFVIDGHVLMDVMCGPEDKEAEAHMEAVHETLSSIKGLLDSKRWEGLKVYIEICLSKEKHLYIDIYVATTIVGALRGPYEQLSIWPEEDHWRVYRRRGNMCHSNAVRALINLDDPGERVETKDLKKFLGIWKKEMRLAHAPRIRGFNPSL